MRKQKLNLARVLCLSAVAALGIMAVTAAYASAADFFVGANKAKAGEKFSFNNTVTSRLLLSGMELQGTVVEGSGEFKSSTLAVGTVTFLGVKVGGNPLCEIENTTITGKYKATPTSLTTVKIEPEAGSVFTEVQMFAPKFASEGLECLLNSPGVELQTLKVTGSVTAKVVNTNEFEFNEATGLFLGATAAKLDFSSPLKDLLVGKSLVSVQ